MYSVYLPAAGSSANYEYVIDEISGLISASEIGTHNRMCGDFNRDIGKGGGPRGFRQHTIYGHLLFNILDGCNPYSMLWMQNLDPEAERCGNIE